MNKPRSSRHDRLQPLASFALVVGLATAAVGCSDPDSNLLLSSPPPIAAQPNVATERPPQDSAADLARTAEVVLQSEEYPLLVTVTPEDLLPAGLGVGFPFQAQALITLQPMVADSHSQFDEGYVVYLRPYEAHGHEPHQAFAEQLLIGKVDGMFMTGSYSYWTKEGGGLSVIGDVGPVDSINDLELFESVLRIFLPPDNGTTLPN